jgi:hypothetical protein
MNPLSASRLNDFLGCPHQAALWLAGIEPEGEVDPTVKLIRDKGFDHEALVLTELENLHGPAVKIPSGGSLADRVKLTREAVERGARLIYQGALSQEPWLGYPDFILQTAAPHGKLLYPKMQNWRVRRRANIFFNSASNDPSAQWPERKAGHISTTGPVSSRI